MALKLTTADVIELSADIRHNLKAERELNGLLNFLRDNNAPKPHQDMVRGWLNTVKTCILAQVEIINRMESEA